MANKALQRRNPATQPGGPTGKIAWIRRGHRSSAKSVRHGFDFPNRLATESAGTPRARRIPLVIKLCISAYIALFVPYYLYYYGPANFLYFCDIALLLSFVGLWLESAALISLCAVAILIPQLVWTADLILELSFGQFGGWTGYMFNSGSPLALRLLSLFHGWLPFLLLYLLFRLGYDRRALGHCTIFSVALVLLCVLFTPPPTPQALEMGVPSNINFVYGLSSEHPETWAPQGVYVVLELIVMYTAIFLPTHLALKRFFAAPSASADPRRYGAETGSMATDRR